MNEDFTHNELKQRNFERRIQTPVRAEQELKGRPRTKQDRNPNRQSRANVRNLLREGRFEDLEEAA